MKIGERLEQLRRESNLGQDVVAEKLEVSKSLISHWENDKREPSYEMLDKLAKLYNTTVSSIFDNGYTGNSEFLNDIILAMKKNGSLNEEGYASCDESSKQMLLAALDNHIKKLIK